MSDLTRTEPDAVDDERPSRPRRHRRLWWILAAVLVAALALVGALAGPTAWAALQARGTTLKTPDTVAGLRRDTADDAAQTAAYLRDALAADLPLHDTVGAVYADPKDSARSVLFFGGTGVFVSPGDELDKALGLLNDQTGTVNGIHSVPAGKLGGVQKCGTAAGDGGGIPVCGWADHGSVAVALFPGRTVDEAGALIAPLREGIEHS